MNKHIENINITQESVDEFLRSPEIKRLLKVFKHMLRGYKPIKRTRKRQIAKAKHMMACHDHTSYGGHNGGTKRLENRRGGNNETN